MIPCFAFICHKKRLKNENIFKNMGCNHMQKFTKSYPLPGIKSKKFGVYLVIVCLTACYINLSCQGS